MNRSTQRNDLERMIELAEDMRENTKSNSLVEMVNEADLHQYEVMRDNDLADFECSVAGGSWHFLSKAHLTERGQTFIEVFGDQNNYDAVKKLARKQDVKINDLSLDEVMELASEHLESKLKI